MRSPIRAFGGAGLLLALVACGGDDSTQTGRAIGEAPTTAEETDSVLNEPPVVDSLNLEPGVPRPGDKVVAEVRYSDPEGDPVTLRYVWRVNGEVAKSQSDRLHVEGERGDLIEVTVTPRDERSQGSSATASARIGNLPPVLHGLNLRPGSGAVPGSRVTVDPQASDPDGDPLDFDYTWFVNDNEVYEARGPVLEPRHFGAGDQLRVRVVAGDGFEESEPLDSDPIAVGNASPRITSRPPAQFDADGVFRYAIEVEDPDDRRFRFALLEGPVGMELDPYDGQLVWAPNETQEGRHPVKVQVRDPKGNDVTQSFAVEVGFVTEEVPAAPDPGSS